MDQWVGIAMFVGFLVWVLSLLLGRTAFCLQGGTQFIASLPATAASDIEQTDEVKDFKEFIKTFAQVANE